ncbi:serine/threonine protein kinase, partial [Streptomyces sp. SB3404]|nr:serine/threonine protein kinase [Streptomyces boncukensis]
DAAAGAPAGGFGPPPVTDLSAALEEVRHLLDAGRFTEVAALLGRTLPAAVAEHGAGSPVVRTLRKQYAAALVDIGQYGLALPELSRLIRELGAERGMNDPAVVQLLQDEALCRRSLSTG